MKSPRSHSPYADGLLSQQFVGKNAEAVDRRGFDTQDDGTERNWMAAVTSREGKFRWREIAFRPDKH